MAVLPLPVSSAARNIKESRLFFLARVSLFATTVFTPKVEMPNSANFELITSSGIKTSDLHAVYSTIVSVKIFLTKKANCRGKYDIRIDSLSGLLRMSDMDVVVAVVDRCMCDLLNIPYFAELPAGWIWEEPSIRQEYDAGR